MLKLLSTFTHFLCYKLKAFVGNHLNYEESNGRNVSTFKPNEIVTFKGKCVSALQCTTRS